ncbi:C-type lectin domain family 5 member A-like [Eleutherodactylus coqui]|uniref:C-type lectin domain family 5 member A-like n=1 Tax=Eleutherodactylus coqui TaxID=57060 RepID=UPI003461DABF
MRNIQDHMRREDSDCYEDMYVNVYEEQNTEENLTRCTEKDNNMTEDTYMKMDEIIIEKTFTRSMEKEASTTKLRRILAALILLIIMVLILVASTSLLLTYYLAMSKEMSQLKNSDLAMSKEMSQLKNSDDLKHFLQDIKALNKTLGTFCRACPTEWKKIGLNCYYFSNARMTWEDAKDDCIRKGSGLTLLKTKEEIDALKSFLEVDRYWIGLRRDTVPKVQVKKVEAFHEGFKVKRSGFYCSILKDKYRQRFD